MADNYYDRNDVVVHLNGNASAKRHGASHYTLKSEEVQDIISKMPHWIIRRGIAVLFALMILIFAGAYFIHYPDIVTTSINITSSDPPVRLVAQSNGTIKYIFVENNQPVKKAETVCVLENTAEYADILLLKGRLNKFTSAVLLPESIKANWVSENLRLGELQPAYADLDQAIHQYLFFLEENFTGQKLDQLQTQVAYQSRLGEELQQRDKLLQQQLMLERKKVLADSSLVKDKVIAPLEYDNSKKELINKQISADATKTGMLQHKLQQAEYLKTITDLRQQTLQQQNDLQQRVADHVKRLQGQLEVWEKDYLIQSPVDGKVVFFKFWKEHQYVSAGEAVMMIVQPVHHYVARASLPIHGAGKVRAGQQVRLKLSSYPFEEFGVIKGKVASVSAVPMDEAYSMEIQLVDGLTTSLHKQIPSQAQLTGTAEVLTSDKTILERLFEKLWLSVKG